MADRQADDARARASRRQQRELASYRGSITEDERRSMNERDAPLAEIPDWAAHLAEIEASGAPTLVQSGQPVDRS
jgi:hypothetical protein